MSVDISSLGQIKFKGTGVGNGVLTVSAPNLTSDVSLSFTKKTVQTEIALASTITAEQSGSIIPISVGGAAGAITLPSAIAGLNYKLVISTAGAKDMVVTRAGADTMEGYLIGSATVVPCASGKTITLTASKALIGDSLDLECYVAGKWAVRGTSQTAGVFVVAV